MYSVYIQPEISSLFWLIKATVLLWLFIHLFTFIYVFSVHSTGDLVTFLADQSHCAALAFYSF